MSAGDVSEIDRELVTRFLGGEAAAFEEIVRRYERPLLRFVSRYGLERARNGAQDIVQEVFLRLLQEGRGLAEVRNLSSWLYRVARNLAIDERRKETRMERRHELAAAPEVAPPAEFPVERLETSGVVAERLLRLPPNQRDVLILKVQEGKSYKEISEITGLSTANVGYLIHHGLRSLAKELRAAGILES
jgi:RNA polymerase sigma-70 factor (ECF subfamily)